MSESDYPKVQVRFIPGKGAEVSGLDPFKTLPREYISPEQALDHDREVLCEQGHSMECIMDMPSVEHRGAMGVGVYLCRSCDQYREVVLDQEKTIF
ncbi:MAG TPA: hypothetical protein VJ746_06385 [Nitrospira sp.]|nr:hypothetical protein [Nitrospira sp.]